MVRDKVIECIKNDNFKTEDCLNYDVFLFVSSITPLVNVDLLVEDEQGRILLAWRDDIHCGTGWHIPGGIVRYKETLLSRLHKTALTELGVDVEVVSDSPIKLTEIIHKQEERGHFVSLLYRCQFTAPFDIKNQKKSEREVGYLRWFDTYPPEGLVWSQRAYEEWLRNEFAASR